ncbi:hypothetical protein [Streptomyces roseolus]|uniref:hypothetical protein n=1 Tax=Streptomyces roseolus TaxID=67358 RepID=UPI0037B95FC6
MLLEAGSSATVGGTRSQKAPHHALALRCGGGQDQRALARTNPGQREGATLVLGTVHSELVSERGQDARFKVSLTVGGRRGKHIAMASHLVERESMRFTGVEAAGARAALVAGRGHGVLRFGKAYVPAPQPCRSRPVH